MYKNVHDYLNQLEHQIADRNPVSNDIYEVGGFLLDAFSQLVAVARAAEAHRLARKRWYAACDLLPFDAQQAAAASIAKAEACIAEDAALAALSGQEGNDG